MTNSTGRDELVERVTEPRQDTVEKVARALLKWEFPSDKFGEIHPASQDIYREMARAAINAMSDVREALDDLQQAEAEYRLMHDRHGDGASATGRAWDRMRRCGDKARAALESLSGGGK